MKPQPRILLLDMTDPNRSLDDPALRALIADGWTLGAAWPAIDNADPGSAVRMMLLLWPPASTVSRVPTATVLFPVVFGVATVALVLGYILKAVL